MHPALAPARHAALLFFAFAGIAACTSAPKLLHDPAPGRERSDYIAESPRGMVAAAHPQASQAGLEMLLAGGNAVDAAVAASFAIGVVAPQYTGIGGGGFLLLYERESRNISAYDFRERAPLNATRDMFVNSKGEAIDFVYNGIRIPDASLNGHLAVGTPGLVAGLVEVQQKHGKLPLQQVMEPAIRLARDGFPVYPSLVEAIKDRIEVLKSFPATTEIFLPRGEPLRAGDLLVQSDLAHTLELIAAHGKAGFYEGEVAQRIVAEFKSHGILTAKDLHEYNVISRTPLTGKYRGHGIVAMPPPSSGGVHIIQILNILSYENMTELGPYSVARDHILIEAMKRAYADRARYLGDPDFISVPVSGLTSRSYAKVLHDHIKHEEATPARMISAGSPDSHESASTTHISVVDQWSNAVSTTQTINDHFGSGVVVKGTGIVMNDEMDDFATVPGKPNGFGLLGGEANAVAARKTMLSSMSPTFLFDIDGNLKLVVGGIGGPRIITATLQTILNIVDHGMSLPDAVHTFRLHHQWFPDEVMYERGTIPGGLRSGLEDLGHSLAERKQIGQVQAIMRTSNGWIGVADTRSDGKPMGH